MGCCSTKRMILGNPKKFSRTISQKSFICKPITIANLRSAKRKGLYTIGEVGASQEFSMAASKELKNTSSQERDTTNHQSEINVIHHEIQASDFSTVL